LEATIRFNPPPAVAKSVPSLKLVGRTKNLSESGMALLVSAGNIDRYLKHQDSTLDVVVSLPTGPIDAQAVPVYYKRFTTGGGGYWIGCRFTKVSGAHMDQLLSFLRSLPPSA
jgi:c-di-GMP-binding flagellar brake protein YcgR